MPQAGFGRVPASLKNALEANMANSVFHPRPPAPALPSSVTDLLAQRKTLRTRSLNDDVEEIHLALWDDLDYRQFFLPIWKEETIEGTFIADELMAAIQIREYANAHQKPIAANAKLAAIIRSLHVVCRRYGISRKERQNLVGVGRDNDRKPADSNFALSNGDE
jgi:hypothetical protein